MRARSTLPRIWRPLRRPAAAVAVAAAVCVFPTAFPATVPDAHAAGVVAADTAALSRSETSGPSKDAHSARFLSLSIDRVTPDSVTSASDPIVSVAGTVSNVGDRPVSDIAVRIQRAAAVSSAAGLRTSLGMDQSNYEIAGAFKTVSKELTPGQRAGFTLTMPLRSLTGASLNITKPGVYPMLVNVNGTPDYGGRARLDDEKFLLPVLGVPADPTATDPTGTAAQPVVPSTTHPVPVTMLYPIAAPPKLAAGTPAGGQPIRLIDDSLATSLTPAGRLGGLLSALSFATGPTVDADHKLASGVCLAVDPDLLVTVNAMTQGYRVAEHPADPTGPTRAGTGQQAARDWLAQLRGLAGKMCTTSLPFAQVDLDALARVGAPGLTTDALASPAVIVDKILGISSVRGLTWPDSGALSSPAATMVASLGQSTALLAADAVQTSGAGGPPPTGRLGGDDGGLSVALFDVPAADALAATGAQIQTPDFTPARERLDLSDDSRTARLQDALGAMVWPALGGEGESGSSGTAQSAGAPTARRAVVLAPPQVWTVDADEASAVLTTLSTLIRSELATPRPLAAVLAEAAAPGGPRLSLDEPDHEGVPDAITDRASNQLPRIDSLTAMVVDDPQATISPQGYTAPLNEDVLRAITDAGRNMGDPKPADQVADDRVRALTSALDAQFAAVTVLAPGSIYTLASSQSPLLLVVRNDLPVAVQVKLQIEAPSGVHITDVGLQQLPPRGTRQLQIPAEVRFSRQLNLRVQLTTPAGRPLGEQIHVTIHSNAYGNAMTIVTAGAGGLLLLLAGRRLWHRFKGQPDPADEGHEAP
ncbi:DUF6049 family protein [Speluncibacter jeojiensis]|uniref:DUF6049 family protein n=1 Tax=Speluncibacter jeojiensis TaxID=2710754 RepID=UPI00240F7E6A|nr:DUF6049 family protein [Rhodococcus sp. D2-41]